MLCQGEFIYRHALVERLLAVGITVLAATSERLVSESYEAGINEKIVNSSVCSLPGILSFINVVLIGKE